MDQSSLNWFFGLINLVLGVVMKMIWDSYKSLNEAREEIQKKLAKVMMASGIGF